MDHLDLANAKESLRTESALSAVSRRRVFNNETPLVALVPKGPVVLPVMGINL